MALAHGPRHRPLRHLDLGAPGSPCAPGGGASRRTFAWALNWVREIATRVPDHLRQRALLLVAAGALALAEGRGITRVAFWYRGFRSLATDRDTDSSGSEA